MTFYAMFKMTITDLSSPLMHHMREHTLLSLQIKRMVMKKLPFPEELKAARNSASYWQTPYQIVSSSSKIASGIQPMLWPKKKKQLFWPLRADPLSKRNPFTSGLGN